jgi:hypothetical protein
VGQSRRTEKSNWNSMPRGEAVTGSARLREHYSLSYGFSIISIGALRRKGYNRAFCCVAISHRIEHGKRDHANNRF